MGNCHIGSGLLQFILLTPSDFVVVGYQVALQHKQIHQIDISSSGVRNVWLRAQMHKTTLRKHKSALL